MTQSKTVGVLGGMGPDATVDFMAKVIALTPAGKDQDHIHMLVDHNPPVPNRQQHIVGIGEDPGPTLAAMAQRLEQAGADFLVIPCNTAQAYEQDILDAVSIPLISIIEETVADIANVAPQAKAVGVLATVGCLQAEMYQRVLTANDLLPVLPDRAELKQLMTLVNGVKAGVNNDGARKSMRDLADALVARGAEVIIAGCTEIPLLLDESMLDAPLISSTDVLAQKTVRLAKPE